MRDTSTMSRRRLVVVGNGMAAGRLLEELIERAPDAFDVTVFGAEPRVNYNRIMLSPVLAGEKSFDDIVIHHDDWYAHHHIDLRKGEKIVAINRETRVVRAESGRETPYDVLVIATGSNPFIIPVPGADLAGVVTFRDLDDVNAMLAAATKGGRAVVIGGGLLGLEAAAGLAAKGMRTTVVHLMPTLMERQLDPAAAVLLQRAIENRGIEILTGANTKAITGAGRVEAVLLDDNRRLPADLVVMAVGIKPNIALAGASGLDVKRGVVVDDFLRTSDPAIFAVGECVEHRGQCYGLVAPLFEMAKKLAATLACESCEGYAGSAISTKLKVTGIDLFSAGDFSAGDGKDEIVLRDPVGGVYKRIVLRGDRIVGAVLYGDTADGAFYFDLIRNGADISPMRDTLIFGRAYQGGASLDPTAAVAALPDDAEASGCNGLWEGAIKSAIASQDLIGRNSACPGASTSFDRRMALAAVMHEAAS